MGAWLSDLDALPRTVLRCRISPDKFSKKLSGRTWGHPIQIEAESRTPFSGSLAGCTGQGIFLNGVPCLRKAPDLRFS